MVAQDEDEEQTIRERERITENQERINVLENKREVEEGTSLRERVRNIFKKYCFLIRFWRRRILQTAKS